MITVIIATYNRSGELKGVLDCLLKQDLPNQLDYEVLIVDNNSNDDTKSVVESHIPSFRGKLKYLFEPRQGKVFALNLGIKEAKGDVIVFTDDDCLIETDYLGNLYEAFHKYGNEIGVVGGKVTPHWINGRPPDWLNQFCSGNQADAIAWSGDDKPDWLGRFFQGPIGILDYGQEPFIIDYSEDTHKNQLFFGANIAIRKEILEQCGYFNIEKIVTEDTEICLRLFNAGVKGLYAPQIVVYHKVDAQKITPGYYYHWSYLRGLYRELQFNTEERHFFQPFGIPIRQIRKMLGLFLKSLSAQLLHQKVFYRSLANFNLGQMVQMTKMKAR